MSTGLQSLIEKAMDAMNAWDFEQASRLWGEAHALSGIPSLLINQAMCHCQMGEPQEALDVLRELLAAKSYPAMAGAIASQCHARLEHRDEALKHLARAIALWEGERTASARAEVPQELMLAAGMLGDHVQVLRIFKSAPTQNTAMKLQAASAYFNRGFYSQAQKLWKYLDDETVKPFVQVAQWIIEGIVPAFTLEYDFDWMPYSGSDPAAEVSRALRRRPLSGMIRVQLLYQTLTDESLPYQRWGTLGLLMEDPGPWRSQFGFQLMKAPWLPRHIRVRTAQLLLKAGAIDPDSPIPWIVDNQVVTTTIAELGLLSQWDCIALAEEAIDCLLASRPEEALEKLERAYHWLPGDYIIGLTLVECLAVQGSIRVAHHMLDRLTEYWEGDPEFHRDAAAASGFLGHDELTRYHMQRADPSPGQWYSKATGLDPWSSIEMGSFWKKVFSAVLKPRLTLRSCLRGWPLHALRMITHHNGITTKGRSRQELINAYVKAMDNNCMADIFHALPQPAQQLLRYLLGVDGQCELASVPKEFGMPEVEWPWWSRTGGPLGPYGSLALQGLIAFGRTHPDGPLVVVIPKEHKERLLRCLPG